MAFVETDSREMFIQFDIVVFASSDVSCSSTNRLVDGNIVCKFAQQKLKSYGSDCKVNLALQPGCFYRTIINFMKIKRCKETIMIHTHICICICVMGANYQSKLKAKSVTMKCVLFMCAPKTILRCTWVALCIRIRETGSVYAMQANVSNSN